MKERDGGVEMRGGDGSETGSVTEGEGQKMKERDGGVEMGGGDGSETGSVTEGEGQKN